MTLCGRNHMGHGWVRPVALDSSESFAIWRWGAPVFRPDWLNRLIIAICLIVGISGPFLFAADEKEKTPEKSSSVPAVVVLEVPQQKDRQQKERPFQKLLVREVIRQAFLLSAREEMHAWTRDRLLREHVDQKNSAQHVFRMDLKSANPEEIALTLALTSGEAPPAPWTAALKSEQLQQLPETVTQAEEWSRSGFVDWMKSVGVPVGKRKSSKVDTDLDDDVPLEFIAQVAFLRKLHAALQQAPKDPAVLARIVEIYAMLGSVTEIHWGAESKVFQARSLLYAERAFHLHPDNAAVAWSRSFAWGLCGRGDIARAEIERAKTLGDGDATPDWGFSLEQFVNWDEKALAECVEKNRKYAAYFQFQMGILSASNDRRVRTINALMQEHPECFRAAYAMSIEPQIGLQRSVGETQFRQFLVSFPENVQSVPGLPATIKTLAQELPKAEDSRAAILKTVDLVKALRQTTPAEETSEPSLSMLATLVQNLHFVHSLQILQTNEWSLGLPTKSMQPLFQLLLRDHPAKRLCGIFDTDTSQGQKALSETVPALIALPVTESAWKLLNRIKWLQVPKLADAINLIWAERDNVLADMLITASDSHAPLDQRRKMLQFLNVVSPDCPGTIVARIQVDWKNVGSKAREWEEHSPSTIVLQALGSRHENTTPPSDKTRAAAERCWKKLIELEPSFQNYGLLAEFYRRTGKYDKWEETQLESLKLSSFGLDEARVKWQLAEWYMSRDQYSKARPFALGAAESYSGWGLLCAARCLEGLQEWEECEKYVQAASERYNNSWLEWYLWCQRTGRGDLEAAREFCFQTIEGLSQAQKNYNEEVTCFFLMERNFPQALEAIGRLVQLEKASRYWGFHGVIACEEEQNLPERNKLLDRMINRPNEDLVYSPSLSELTLRPRDSKSPTFSPAQCQFCYHHAMLAGDGTNYAYFLGENFLLRGREEDGLHWLKIAAASPTTNKWNCVMAMIELRRREIDLPSTRKTEIEPEFAEAFQKVVSANSLLKSPRHDQAVEAAEKALKLKPDWPLAQYVCAQALVAAKKYPQAEEMYSRLINQVPGLAQFHVKRAQNRETMKDFAGARTDYEAAHKLAPTLKLAMEKLNSKLIQEAGAPAPAKKPVSN